MEILIFWTSKKSVTDKHSSLTGTKEPTKNKAVIKKFIDIQPKETKRRRQKHNDAMSPVKVYL